MNAELSHAEQNAAAWAESISDYVEAADPETWERLEGLREERDECADTAYPMDGDDLAELERLEKLLGDYEGPDYAREAAGDSPLCVEVRSGWSPLGSTLEAEEFAILLSTGGPALRIRGELNQGEPSRAWMEYQDWGTPWTQYFDVDSSALLTFCSFFYFGE